MKANILKILLVSKFLQDSNLSTLHYKYNRHHHHYLRAYGMKSPTQIKCIALDYISSSVSYGAEQVANFSPPDTPK